MITEQDTKVRNWSSAAELPSVADGEHHVQEVGPVAEYVRRNWGETPFRLVRNAVDPVQLEHAMIVDAPESLQARMGAHTVGAMVVTSDIHHYRDINARIALVNSLLRQQGLLIGRCSTIADRRERMRVRFGRLLGTVAFIGDFVLNRIIPRLPVVEHAYFRLTNGRYYGISTAETLGRLVHGGFHIVDMCIQGPGLYFVAQRLSEPACNRKPSFYPLVRLPRIGKNGKTIGVYKIRTMHPYSEYLQRLVVDRNGYNHAGKPANDFRVTKWGVWLRRIWIDEVPQVLNVLKGEMKLVGVRPLSRSRFDELPPDLRRRRVQHRPGCIPPYVSLNMPSAEANIEAECIYLDAVERRPLLADVTYTARAMANIVAGRIRSC